MAKLVKILTAKLNKLELEKGSNKPAPEGERNPNNQNQFRRQFAPRFMPRERRNNDIQRERRENEDQKVPPPLQNNVADEEEVDEELLFEETDQDMNHFGEVLSEGFVTEEEFLNAEIYDADMFKIENDIGLEKTAVTAAVHQNEPKKTINLRSGPKHVVQAQKKRATVPAATAPAKQTADPVTEKKQAAEKLKKTIEVEEVNKSVQNFSLENELGKLKIPVPLTELIRNPSYKESVIKMLNPTSNQPVSDTVNLQEDSPNIFIGSALAGKTENEA